MALTQRLPLERMQVSWAQDIEPVLDNPLNSCLILKKVVLVSGTNNVNHMLGRPLQGWYIVRKRSAANIYDNQDANPNPQLTLTLVSSAACTVDIACF